MPEKYIADLEEEHDTNLSYVDGSDRDGINWQNDEIILHNQNFAEWIEYDQMQSLKEAGY